MTLPAKTENGEALDVVEFDGLLATVHSARPFAPGQPLTLVVALEPAFVAEARTVAAKRLPEGPFEVRVRLISLKREERQRLLEAMPVSRRA
jgi:hypothetical protein